jgi:hypothetical protein
MGKWPLTQLDGYVVERACEALCTWGTRDALGAVVDVMRRAALLPRVERLLPGPWGLPLLNQSGDLRRLSPEGRDRIGDALMRRLVSLGVTPTAGVYDGSAEAWKLMLEKERDRIPARLPETRPTTRTAMPESRPK